MTSPKFTPADAARLEEAHRHAGSSVGGLRVFKSVFDEDIVLYLLPSLLAAWRELETDNGRLREALTNVLDDIASYERANNLTPNPGRDTTCWASVAAARAILKEAEREARLAAEVEIARLERLCADLSNPDLSQRIETAAREMVARTLLSVRELEGERGWRPISEAPKDVPILTWNGCRIGWAQWWTYHGGAYWIAMGGGEVFPTYWRPLPLPPKT